MTTVAMVYDETVHDYAYDRLIVWLTITFNPPQSGGPDMMEAKLVDHAIAFSREEKVNGDLKWTIFRIDVSESDDYLDKVVGCMWEVDPRIILVDLYTHKQYPNIPSGSLAVHLDGRSAICYP